MNSSTLYTLYTMLLSIIAVVGLIVLVALGKITWSDAGPLLAAIVGVHVGVQAVSGSNGNSKPPTNPPLPPR